MKILYSPHFKRAYKKLSAEIKNQAEKREQLFRENDRDPRLKTHKLKGEFKEFWSFSVTYSHRIVFTYESRSQVTFHDIGDHDVYK